NMNTPRLTTLAVLTLFAFNIQASFLKHSQDEYFKNLLQKGFLSPDETHLNSEAQRAIAQECIDAREDNLFELQQAPHLLFIPKVKERDSYTLILYSNDKGLSFPSDLFSVVLDHLWVREQISLSRTCKTYNGQVKRYWKNRQVFNRADPVPYGNEYKSYTINGQYYLNCANSRLHPTLIPQSIARYDHNLLQKILISVMSESKFDLTPYKDKFIDSNSEQLRELTFENSPMPSWSNLEVNLDHMHNSHYAAPYFVYKTGNRLHVLCFQKDNEEPIRFDLGENDFNVSSIIPLDEGIFIFKESRVSSAYHPEGNTPDKILIVDPQNGHKRTEQLPGEILKLSGSGRHFSCLSKKNDKYAQWVGTIVDKDNLYTGYSTYEYDHLPQDFHISQFLLRDSKLITLGYVEEEKLSETISRRSSYLDILDVEILKTLFSQKVLDKSFYYPSSGIELVGNNLFIPFINSETSYLGIIDLEQHTNGKFVTS
ncbi:MAG: hypothetical protein GY915_09110, partial [bacterium]|nr:hypothetical protein [bacterium]